MSGTWINVNEFLRFPSRIRMVLITQMDLVEANSPDGFGNMATVLDCWNSQPAIEHGVRVALLHKFPSSSDWLIVGVRFRMEMYRLEVMVEHPSFEPVPLGEMPPEIQPEEVSIESSH